MQSVWVLYLSGLSTHNFKIFDTSYIIVSWVLLVFAQTVFYGCVEMNSPKMNLTIRDTSFDFQKLCSFLWWSFVLDLFQSSDKPRLYRELEDISQIDDWCRDFGAQNFPWLGRRENAIQPRTTGSHPVQGSKSKLRLARSALKCRPMTKKIFPLTFL